MYARVDGSEEGTRGSVVLARGQDTMQVAVFDGDDPGDAYDLIAYQLLKPDDARYARVSKHEGDPMRDVSPAPLMTLDGIVGTMMLVDRRTGRGLGFIFFDSEEAMRKGDAIVRESDPGTAGEASETELYDVVGLTLR